MDFDIKNQKGQGLLELVVAIGVITVGLFSVWGLFISNFNGEQEAGARILSINLAREGVEIVKNIRDSNWLAIENNDSCFHNSVTYDPCYWDSGLDGDGSGIIVNPFSENVLLDYLAADNLNDGATTIYSDPITGLYSHDNSGQPTTYHRLIETQNICCSDANNDLQCDDFNVDFTVKSSSCLASELKVGIDVKSAVSWTLVGQNRNISVQERIFNWK
ncbi:hypothetical protein GW933_02805 [Candidatus Falkowbacteria bacterium]|uniref:Uncharacterized protein n=1 Tax=Candidatus Buchananbacteria bacterium CG10_big_fil_rev_8_21_14_0_10_33_19 TaxID=1974525 RepID=A0A2H0W4G2_9BACT|nr:hypothetical protein [Candidatus Falkowbacteria bacterium]PIS06239.1 MAG: hypothetical protein COT80_01560 [Candidatus Buchananbacteria bacterium CG10_big_fil_rev_8_21_14_0_10_33_19]